MVAFVVLSLCPAILEVLGFIATHNLATLNRTGSKKSILRSCHVISAPAWRVRNGGLSNAQPRKPRRSPRFGGALWFLGQSRKMDLTLSPVEEEEDVEQIREQLTVKCDSPPLSPEIIIEPLGELILETPCNCVHCQVSVGMREAFDV